MKSIVKPIFLILCSVILLGSCNSDETVVKKEFNLNIRMPIDPGGINPMVGNATVEKTAINSLVFLPLAHYDQSDFTLSPVLITQVPEPRKMENGSIAYDYEILDDAVWDDGKPITSSDYLFTVKAAMNPDVDATSWRGLLSPIDSIEIDQENEKKFSVIYEDYFMLALIGSATVEIFPEHIYDPEQKLAKYSISQIINSDSTDLPLVSFAKEFNSIKYTQETISGAGPYKVKVREADQYIVLEKKENYWGENYPDRGQLANNPKEITYRIIADENTASTLLKDGSIDLMVVKSAAVFDNLVNSTSFDSMFTIATPAIPVFYYIGLNNKRPELSDKDVRRALAHLVDVDNIIENLENGYATRQVGTIMPAAEYYNKNMKPIEYDLSKAIEILDKEGWKDTNGNGIRDKIIDGSLVELEVDYLASQSPLGQKVGLLFQDNAKKAGVAVKMEIKEGRKMQEAISARDYESSASAIGFSIVTLASYDPYQRWHSDNSQPGKGNLAGYENERNDELIETIRTEEDAAIRRQAYLDLQELMYDEQPVIFLYAPSQKFVLNKKFKGAFSMKRPGYFVGSFEMNE